MGFFISKFRAILAASVLVITMATPVTAWSWYFPYSNILRGRGHSVVYAYAFPRLEPEQRQRDPECSQFYLSVFTPALNSRIQELVAETSLSETDIRQGLVDECLEGDISPGYTGPLPTPDGQSIASISEYSKSNELDLAASLLPRSIAVFSPRLRFVTEDGHFAFSMQRFGLTMEHKFIGDSGITSLQFNRKFGKNEQHLFQLNGELDRSHTDLNLSDYGLGTLYFDPQYSVNARLQFRW